MKHKEPSYLRKKNKITEVATGKVETFPSISAAKLQSRHLQKANGGLGAGYVKVVK